MFENLKKLFRINKKIDTGKQNSKNRAKERLHLVLMQDRANVSADFLDLMRKEIIEVIKKYIDIDEKSMDVRLTTETNEDGTQGAPALYANIPIISIKEETRKNSKVNQDSKIIEATKDALNDKVEDKKEEKSKDIQNNNTQKDESKEEKKDNFEVVGKNQNNTEKDEKEIIEKKENEEIELNNLENNNEKEDKSYNKEENNNTSDKKE